MRHKKRIPTAKVEVKPISSNATPVRTIEELRALPTSDTEARIAQWGFRRHVNVSDDPSIPPKLGGFVHLDSDVADSAIIAPTAVVLKDAVVGVYAELHANTTVEERANVGYKAKVLYGSTVCQDECIPSEKTIDRSRPDLSTIMRRDKRELSFESRENEELKAAI